MNRELTTTVQIGKNGLTEQLIRELDKQLRKRKIVKIKLLKSSMANVDKGNLVKKILSATKSRPISIVGHTLVIEK